MAKRILVSLDRNDPLDEIMIYVEEIARPDMKIVFLVQWNRDCSGQLKDVRTGTQTGMETAAADANPGEFLELQQQRLLEDKIFSACRGLQHRGVEIGVDIYAGSWGEMMEKYKGEDGYILIL